MAEWQVQEAKARFNEVIERARTEGPQTITRRGRECAVLLSIEDYRTLLSRQADVRALLLGGPKVDDFTIERSGDTGRRSPMPPSVIAGLDPAIQGPSRTALAAPGSSGQARG